MKDWAKPCKSDRPDIAMDKKRAGTSEKIPAPDNRFLITGS
jgi:hypothetical protein